MFPEIITFALTQVTSNTTNHTINMPAGVEVGDQIFVIHTTRRGAPSSWNAGRDLVQNDGRAGLYMTVVSKIADGSDALTFSVISNGYTAICIRIPGAVIAGSTKGGSAVTADPDNPNLILPAVKKYLFIAFASVSGGLRAITDEPANYIDGLISTNVFASNQFTTSVLAVRELEAISDDPGLWDITGADPSTFFGWWTATVAVELTAQEQRHGPWEMML